MEREVEKGFCDRFTKTKCRNYGGRSFCQKSSGLLTTWTTKKYKGNNKHRAFRHRHSNVQTFQKAYNRRNESKVSVVKMTCQNDSSQNAVNKMTVVKRIVVKLIAVKMTVDIMAVEKMTADKNNCRQRL